MLRMAYTSIRMWGPDNKRASQEKGIEALFADMGLQMNFAYIMNLENPT